MEEGDLRALETIFAQVEDPRVERTKQHQLRDIIIIAMCGVICGADGWVGIEEFGKAKEAWLTELLKLPNGIPSHDTFGRVFEHIDPKQFEASFLQGVQGISTTIKEVIAIDGKTSRRTHDQAAGKKALHLVSAWAVENRLVLAQQEAFATVACESDRTVAKAHGRLESRAYWTISDPAIVEYLDPQKRWKGLRGIGMVRAERRIEQEITKETRYASRSVSPR
jgi:hypothetical protein